MRRDGEFEHGGPMGSDNPGWLMNEHETNRFEAVQEAMIRPLDRESFFSRHRFDLEASDQVVTQGGDLLPCGVGSVVVGRNCVECPLALEFSDRLFLSTAPSHELPEERWLDVAVGGNSRVFEVPVGRVEEIELVVLTTLERHAFSVDHDTQRPLPARDVQLDLEIADAVGKMMPSFAFEEGEYFLLEESAVHSEFQREIARHSRIQIIDEFSNDGYGFQFALNLSTQTDNSLTIPITSLMGSA